MWRAVAVFLGFLAVAWFEFDVFPGHTYLASTSQLYLPAIEHLTTPGYLSRDLVATHPHLAYTVYDEATLFLHSAARLDFQKALVAQQIVCRIAAVLGVFLIGRAAGMKPPIALLVTALVNLGTYLPGPAIQLIDTEPVPRSFATGLTLLAVGWLVFEKPLLAAFSGGLALLYDPVMSAPFWLVALAAFVFDKQMRTLVKPMLPVLVVFVLLLANLAQLQPGTPDAQPFFSRVSDEAAAIELFRTPDLWVSHWPHGSVYLYVGLFVITIWAVTRVWLIMNRPLRWALLGLPLAAVIALLYAAILLEHYRWSAILRMQPAQWLLYLVVVFWFACATAALTSIQRRARVEALIWLTLALMPLVVKLATLSNRESQVEIREMAVWAESTTWGSSMFAFPDAGRELYPGVFRAVSRRALWVDWQSGRQINYYVALAAEWNDRWRDTMQGPVTGDHLQSMLSLPIDYFVFKRDHLVETITEGGKRTVKPVFVNGKFAVYETSNLRRIPGKLTVTDVKSPPNS
jgi:hypothetical protein